ncbi:MAG TPA: helix-turn-helix transcriptional regulator [Steroidobacteraceae bacterium]|nr:helix-turn-helix transcriptional regulator [Steroidobacteraceae bacterium]
MIPKGNRLAEFGAHTTTFVCQVLGAEWGCFYRLDEEGQPYAFQPHRTPWALRAAYLEHNVEAFDPLHPARLIEGNCRFISMFDSRLASPAAIRRKFWEFLSAFGSRDAAEMILRVGGRAVAGLSLVWVGKPGLVSDRHRGEALQSYVEYNLATHYRTPQVAATGVGSTRPGLTDRERQVVRLVCEGSTNAQIADHLNIGLATVKTHLIHVFHKLGVETRTALVSRILTPVKERIGA